MGKNNKDLTPKQIKLIIALLECPSKAQAVKRAGVTMGVYYRCLEDPAFMVAYTDAVNKLLDLNISKLQNATGKAIDVVIELMDDDNKMLRLNASRTIIDNSFKSRDLAIGKKLDELDEIIKGNSDTKEVIYFEK